MPILTSEERIGTLLAEKYRLDRIIGKGGMGVVFGGEHTWTGRQVAVKIIHPTLAEDKTLVERLLREARAAASLNHPNAVQVLDMGADADETVFLVLEQLTGESLDARLQRPPLPTFAETLAILLPVMNALALAHETGLVHRDLKPDNIFLHAGPTGVIPTLLDFGIAKVIQEGGAKVTQTGVVMGTPHYIAPEQAVGESTVGPPADVWAMGVLFFECLTGQMPFDGETSTKIVMKVVSQRAPRLAELGIEPIGAAQAIDRALEPDLSIRYANMREFADALWAAATQAGFATVPSVAPPPPGASVGAVSSAPVPTPADGSAPLVTFTPARRVGPTQPMKATPLSAAPLVSSHTPHAKPATKPWALIVLAAVLLAIVGVTGGVVLFGAASSSSEAAAPIAPVSAPVALEADPAPVTEPPPEGAGTEGAGTEGAGTEAAGLEAEGVETTELDPEQTAQDDDAPAAADPEPSPASGRRSSRRARRGAGSGRTRPEISSSW